MSTSVSASLLDVLGFRPYVGRLIAPEDNLNPDRPAVVLLGYDFWLRRFAGDRAAVGKTINIEGFPIEIVGIARHRSTGGDTRGKVVCDR